MLLEYLYVSCFDTSKVEDMSFMIEYLSSVESLKLKLDTTSVNNISKCLDIQ